jgi:uncharacterized protein YndB with AHSA1/START domain
MKPSAGGPKYSGISSEAVRAKTGKGWSEWLRVLDAAGAKKLTHQEIVALLRTEHGVGPWWQQMVTVGYEQARGLRVKHQKGDLFSIGVSKTISAPISVLYKAWSDEKRRSRWLGGKRIVVRTAKPRKYMRVTWADGKSNLLVNFYPRGNGRGQVVVSHEKLPDAKSAAQMKSYWSKMLGRMQLLLER